ncbi:MAG: MFS transporter [Elusimicrobia bacterium RIFOXYB2_FULL_48_7]|nr:MAG: MFS transporter [Elusimicrobia bacterium RIFOXYB2_FULL_48_7]
MQPEKKIFGFPKNIFYMGLVSFFTDMSSEMIYPLLPVFLTGVLKAPMSFVGLVEGVAESTASIMKLVAGWLSDKFNKRKVFVSSGYTLSSVIRPMVAFAAYPWHVLFVRFADRMGKGIRTAPRDALIADTCDPQEKGKAFGFHRAMDHAGAIAGPAIAAVLLAYSFGYRQVFALAFIPAVIAVFIVIFLVKDKNPDDFGTCAPPPGSQGTRVKLGFNIFDKNFKKYLAIVLLFTLGNSSDAFLLLRAKDEGIAVAVLPMLWILLHVVKMLSSTPGGALSDKIGRKKVIAAGWVIYFLVYLGFALAKAPAHIWVLFAVYGFFFGLTESAEKAFVADLVKSEARGSAYGTYNFAIGIGALPASLLMGVLWQKFGVVTAFSFGAAMALVSALLLTVFVKEGNVS